MWHRGGQKKTYLLHLARYVQWGRGRIDFEKRRVFRERKSNFSLDFPVFEQLGFRRAKKQSCSMLQGLCVGTDFGGF